MKKAILFLVEGPHDSKLGMVREKMAEMLGQRGYTVRSSEYSFDHPEEVTVTLGNMVKFATGYRPSDNGRLEENMEAQTIGFKAWLRPILREMGKEIWYGKNRPKEASV